MGLNAGGAWDASSSTTKSTKSGYVIPGLLATTPTGLAAGATANGVIGTSAGGFIGGGLAYGGAETNAQVSGLLTPPNFVGAFANSRFTGAGYSDTRVGWTAGGGLEWLFLPN